MKLDIKFILFVILANTIVLAAGITSSTSWYVLALLSILSNVTIFHRRNVHIQMELDKADIEQKIDELVAAENASRKLLGDVTSHLKSTESKVKKHDETIARIHSELSRTRGRQRTMVRSGNGSNERTTTSEQVDSGRIGNQSRKSEKEATRTDRPIKQSGETV